MKVEIVKIYNYGVLVVNEEKNIKTMIPIRELSDKYIDNIYDEFYEGQIIKVLENGYDNRGKIAVSRKKYILNKKQKQQDKIWEHEQFDKAYKINTKVTIQEVIKKVKIGYEVKIDGGLIAIVTDIPRNIINLEEYLKFNSTEAVIKKIDKQHRKIYLSLLLQELDDIEEIEYKDLENHKLYIDIQKHKSNIVNDLKDIQKNDNDFFKLYDINNMEIDEVIDTFFTKVLLEDMEQNLFFSNTSLDDTELKLVVRLDRSQRILKDINRDKTILLQGYIQHNNPVFVINRVLLQGDYPKKKFEIARNTTIYFRPEDVYEAERERNILTQEFISKLPPLSKIAKKRLVDWEEFINWQEEYINRNMIGFKYLSYEISQNSDNEDIIVFKVVLDKMNEKRLKRLAKNGELAIYPNAVSSKTYQFIYNSDNKKFIKMIQIGDFEDSFSTNIPNSEIKAIRQEITEPIMLNLAFNLRDNENELIDINQIPDDGFLAINTIGNLTQIRRQKRALESVIRGNTFNPFLSSWLFNINNADTPATNNLDLEFFNKNLNEDQKRAVTKMILAPNIGLLQGPPGTGKTTVIAEIIQQSIKDGKKVLLSSQSNLAVDNALDRLADSNEIRAIRLGRESKVSEDAKKFLEKNIVNNFYKKIANNLQKKFLIKKQEAQEQLNDLRQNQSNIKILNKKEHLYKDKIEKITQEQEDLFKLFNQEKTRFEKQKEINGQLESKKNGFKRVLRYISGDNEQNFYIENFDFLNNIYRDIKTIEDRGINLYINDLLNVNMSIDKKNRIFKEFLNKIIKLPIFIENIRNDIVSNDSNTYENEQLKKELNEVTEQLDELDEESDKFRNLWKRRKEIKKVLKSVDQSFLDKKIYSDLLSANFYNQIQNKNTDEQKQELQNILSLENLNIHNKIKNLIEQEINQIEIIDIDDKELKRYETKIRTLKEDIKNLNISISNIKQEINKIYNSIAKRYKINSDEIEDNILLLEEHLQHSFSEQLIDFIERFHNRIENHKLDEIERENILEKYIKNSNVVALTLNENIKILENKSFSMFDIVIIDEVSKATPPELLNMMSLGKKVILVGDHRQLPPVWGYNDDKGFKEHIEQENKNNRLTKENYEKFEKMVNASLFKEYFEQADDSIKESLLTQYRMHTQIMELINYFYEGKLKQGLNKPDSQREHGISLKIPYEVIAQNKHSIWIDTTNDKDGNFNKEDDSGKSKSNKLEVEVIEKILEKLNKQYLELGYKESRRKEVGVIAFYGGQVSLLRKTIGGYKRLMDRFKALKVEINTVDKYQGKEKEIIIVSMTRNKKINPKYKKVGAKTPFIAQFERINVAFSRAKELLIIVGAKEMFEDYEVKLPKMDKDGHEIKLVYKNIIKQIKNHNGLYKIQELKGLQ